MLSSDSPLPPHFLFENILLGKSTAFLVVALDEYGFSLIELPKMLSVPILFKFWKKQEKKTAARKNPTLLPWLCTAANLSSNEVNSADGTHILMMDEMHTSVVGILSLTRTSEDACNVCTLSFARKSGSASTSSAFELIIKNEARNLLK